MIAVKNLSKYYDGFCAVDNVSFEVEKGEIFGFLGPNGAGKTTTVRVLSTILHQNSGDIKIGNWDIKKDSFKIKQMIGLVPETANVYPDLTAFQNLKLMCDLYDVPNKIRKEKIENILKQFQLYDRMNVKTKHYSKGLKQRLILCMALIHNPQILFLDEPTAGLDVQSSRVIKNLIREYNKNGMTIFLTTHNMEVASELCDRIAIINNGRIIALDSPQNLKKIFQQVQTIEIKFNDEIEQVNLKNLSEVDKAIKIEDYYRLSIKNPTNAFIEIMDFVQKNNLKLIKLSLQTPKFEDIFLKIIEES